MKKVVLKFILIFFSLFFLTACDTFGFGEPDEMERHEVISVYISVDNQLIVKHYNGSTNTYGPIANIEKVELTEDGELFITKNGNTVNAGTLITYLTNPFVERRVTENYIQWRNIDEEIWYNLIPLSLLTD